MKTLNLSFHFKNLIKMFIISGVSFLLSSCLEDPQVEQSSFSGPALEVVPNIATVNTNGTRQIFGVNGLAPYTYSLASGIGSVSTSGLYTAPATVGNAVVRVTDSFGSEVLALIFIVNQVQVTPSTLQITTTGVQGFSASGGTPPFTFSVPFGSGSVDSTGLFTAASPGTSIVRVTDSSSQYTDAVVTTVALPSISPSSLNIGTQGQNNFTVTGGTPPFEYLVKTLGGGTISSTLGIYTAPNVPGSHQVAVRDRYGFESVANVQVFASNEIAVGLGHICSLKGFDNEVYCWGQGTNGQLGQGNTSHIGDESPEMGSQLLKTNLGILVSQDVKQITANEIASCALFNDGKIKCWGGNDRGQLGLGNTNPRGEGTGSMGGGLPNVNLGSVSLPSQISSAGNHTCALFANGRIKCWGENASGQLGQGDTVNRGDGVGLMGNSLAFIDMNGELASSVYTGKNHSCAIMASGSLRCWGNNSSGQLGYGDTNSRGDGPGEMGANLLDINLSVDPGVTVIDVALGEAHTCALFSNSRLKCWGSNSSGQLGYGDTVQRTSPDANYVDVGSFDPGTGPVPRGSIKIAAGGNISCAITDLSNLKCWGLNNLGQLGQGSTNNLGDNSGEMGNSLISVKLGTSRLVKRVSISETFVCTVLDDNRIKCFGDNTFGQFGIESTVGAGTNPSQMGENLLPANFF